MQTENIVSPLEKKFEYNEFLFSTPQCNYLDFFINDTGLPKPFIEDQNQDIHLNKIDVSLEFSFINIPYPKLYRTTKHTKKEYYELVKLQLLSRRKLKEPIDVIIEPDDDAFIARTIDLPLFGSGSDRIEALDMLKSEIESLYEDLIEDDLFSEEWLNYKNFLKERIVE